MEDTDHQLKIIVDDREPADYPEKIRFYAARLAQTADLGNEPIVETRRLDCGDFLILDNDCPIGIIERKTFEDLGASIPDKRFLIQLKQMSESEIPNKYVVIDGPPPNTANWRDQLDATCGNIKIGGLWTALIAASARGFTVLQGPTSAHFCILIARLAVRLGEKMSKFGGCGAGIGGGAEMGAGSQPIDISEQRVVKVARCKRAIASEDFLAIALSTIEGISRPVANTIAAKFNGSVLELATQINADPDATHTKIRNIEHAKSGRKIAGKIADKIIERFSSRTEPTAE